VNAHNMLLRNVVIDCLRVFLCRIFVNRSLNMSKIKYIGFDMDYTLAGIPIICI